MKYQVAIIGGGPAGYTAAEAAGKAGLSVVSVSYTHLTTETESSIELNLYALKMKRTVKKIKKG